MFARNVLRSGESNKLFVQRHGHDESGLAGGLPCLQPLRPRQTRAGLLHHRADESFEPLAELAAAHLPR
ncbi:MAG: hypothetical protein ACR2RB_13360 [Gammaproteobacteria bacterium]